MVVVVVGQGWFCKFTTLGLFWPCWPLSWPDSGRSWRKRFEKWGRGAGGRAELDACARLWWGRGVVVVAMVVVVMVVVVYICRPPFPLLLDGPWKRGERIGTDRQRQTSETETAGSEHPLGRAASGPFLFIANTRFFS